MLNLNSIKKANAALQRALTNAENISQNDASFEFARSAVIQTFEFSFELSWKFIMRFLQTQTVENLNVFNKKEIFRIAAKKGLIDNIELWFEFLKARNKTSHTYEEQTADEVYQIAFIFIKEMNFLLANLEKYND